MDDGGAGVLAERKFALAGHFRVAQEGEGYILVVLGSLRIGKDLRHLLIVGTAEHKAHVTECSVGHKGKAFLCYLEHLVAIKLRDAYILL